MNALSVCPDRYKRGVIRTYVRRALKVCSTWELIDNEIHYVKKMLMSNNYSLPHIEREIRAALDDYLQPKRLSSISNVYLLYYKNHMSGAYKIDKRILKGIVKANVTPTENNTVSLRIYYRSTQASSLVMRNNLNKTNFMKSTNIVYRFTCPYEDCQPRDSPVCYVGHTTTTLSRRLTYHKQNGELEKHVREKHGTGITREDLVENTRILHRETKTGRFVFSRLYIFIC